VERVEPGGLFEQQLPPGNNECIVFQDAHGEYYFYYDFSQGGGEYLAKFRAPRGTSDFVKHHFRDGVNGVDMDLVLPEDGTAYYDKLWKEQKDLARLKAQAVAHGCACEGNAKRVILRLWSSCKCCFLRINILDAHS